MPSHRLACILLIWSAACAHAKPHDFSWADATYDLGDGQPITFMDAHYAELDAAGTCEVCMNVLDLALGDITGDGEDEAALLISTNLGGAGTDLSAFIFQLTDGKPRLLGEIQGGDRGDGGIEHISIDAGILHVRRFESGEGYGTCCPSQITEETWRWSDGSLRQQSRPRVVEQRGNKPWHQAFNQRRLGP